MNNPKVKKERTTHKRAERVPTEHEAQGGMALQAFMELCAADRHKRAPDPVAVAFIAEGFVKWWQGGGAQTLEKVLGLTAIGRGGTPMLQALNADLRDGWYRHCMSILVGADFTIEEAAEAVAEHQQRNPDVLNRMNEKPLQWKTVRDNFERDGGVKWARENNYFGDADSIPEGRESTITLGAERQHFIKQLAPHLIPLRFKSSGKS